MYKDFVFLVNSSRAIHAHMLDSVRIMNNLQREPVSLVGGTIQEIEFKLDQLAGELAANRRVIHAVATLN